MAFTIGQMFGGWRKKGEGKKALRGGGEFSRRGRAPTAFPEPIEKKEDKAEKISEPASGIRSKGESNLAWEILTAPHISEKATMMGESKYVFKVSGRASKVMLKRAVESRYNVKVNSVNIANMPAKKRRRGPRAGLKPGFKKAIIALKAGHTISEF